MLTTNLCCVRDYDSTVSYGCTPKGTHGLFFTGQLGNLWSLSMSVEADLVIGGGNVSDDASTVG